MSKITNKKIEISIKMDDEDKNTTTHTYKLCLWYETPVWWKYDMNTYKHTKMDEKNQHVKKIIRNY